MKYVDASAILRVVLRQGGVSVDLSGSEPVASSHVVEVETCRALDRERLMGHLDDLATALKRKELSDLLLRLDLAPVSQAVIDRAKGSFPVNLRALDAIHVATAELLVAEATEAVEFWTHDARQAAAALSRGLTVRGIDSLDEPPLERTGPTTDN